MIPAYTRIHSLTARYLFRRTLIPKQIGGHFTAGSGMEQNTDLDDGPQTLGVRAGGRDQDQASRLESLTKDDMRRLRLGLGTAMLLDEVYFGFDRGDCLHGQLWWFDEYDVDLGAPVAPLEADSPHPGTLQRRFTHGRVIVNPTGQAVTVTFPEPLRDASTGVVGSTIVIPPSDARLLMLPARKSRCDVE